MEDDSEDPNLPRPQGRGAGNSWREFFCLARDVVKLATATVELGSMLTLVVVAGATNSMPHEGHGVTELAAVLHEIVSYL
ncbi:hypothetical protein ABIA39_007462 [Nocardia sp. GAS34]|uniref:hypothetical protein n=1 Tax=unclassified Nocardia TaxID=2637762 RepID=UPI003D1BE181